MPDNNALGQEGLARFIREIENMPRGLNFANIRPPGLAIDVAVAAKPTKKGVPLFRELLEAVEEIYEIDTAYVTGGAIRDTILGVPYADVDLFIPLGLKTFLKSAEELGWTLRGQLGHKSYLEGEPTQRYLAAVGGQVIDVVLLGPDRKEDPVLGFPAYWTRGKYTLKDGYVLTDEFKRDLENKTCTLKPDLPLNQRDNLVKRFDAWVARTGLTEWKLEIEGLDKNWYLKYNAEKALKMKKAKPKKASHTWAIIDEDGNNND